jgi:PAS domain S-box-containing protein
MKRQNLQAEVAALRQKVAELETAARGERPVAGPPPIEETFRILARAIPGIVYLCNNDARYSMRYLNDKVHDILGVPASDFLVDRVSFVDLYHPDDVAAVRSEVDAAIAQRRQFHLVYRLRHTGGHYVWVEEWGQGVFDDDGALEFLEGAVFDISHRLEVDEARQQSHAELEERVERRTAELAETEEQFRQLAENIQEVFWITSPDKRTLYYVSPAAEAIYGLPRHRFYERPAAFLDALHPDDRERVRASLPQQAEGGWQQEFRVVHPDGSIRWLWARAFPVRNERGEVYRVAGITEDITARRLIEDKLRAEERTLSKLLDLQERERKLLAYDIHDGLIQDVIASQLMVGAVRHELERKNAALFAQLSDAWDLLGKSINDGRRLISQLRPTVIDEQGLVAAISYLVAEEQQRKGPRIAFFHDVKFDRLASLLENSLFRIVQEAISNVKRHSGANRADVRLTQLGQQIRLEIRDAGCGFDPSCVPEDRFGLEGIARRAQLFGGAATIESKAGKGTRVLVEVPVILP